MMYSPTAVRPYLGYGSLRRLMLAILAGATLLFSFLALYWVGALLAYLHLRSLDGARPEEEEAALLILLLGAVGLVLMLISFSIQPSWLMQIGSAMYALGAILAYWAQRRYST